MAFPYLPFYATDWLADQHVRVMSLEARGLYIDLIAMCWLEGSVPSKPKELARITAVSPDTIKRLWPELKPHFIPTNQHRMSNRRIHRERNELLARHQALSSAGTVGAATRHSRRNEKSVKELVGSQSGARESTTSALAPATSLDDHEAISTRSDQIRSDQELHPGAEPRRRETWVTKAGEAWHAAYGGRVPYAKIGSHLKPLHVEYGEDAMLAAWVHYLSLTSAQYASPSRFAETYGSWATGNGHKAADGPVSEEEARSVFRAAGLPIPMRFPQGGFANRQALDRAVAASRHDITLAAARG